MSRKYSEIWNHFEEQDNEGKCNYCSRMISISSGSTGNLTRHLRVKHPGVKKNRETNRSRAAAEETAVQKTSTDDENNSISEPCEKICKSQASSSFVSSILSTNSASSSSGMLPSETPRRKYQSNIDNFVVSAKPISIIKSKQFDQQLVKMIVKEYHPFSIVEDPEFKNFVYMLCPGYKLPCRKTISTSLIPQIYNNCRENLKIKLKTTRVISVTTDGWTSINHESFEAITVHWINDNAEMQSYLLDCISFNEKHTSANLTELLRNKFQEWEISNKITCIVSDNAYNIVGAIRNGNWRHWGCFAHKINLIVQAGLTELEETLNKVRRIVEYFKRSSNAASRLNQVQEQMGMSVLKLKIDVSTRWNSSWDMIKRVTERQEPIISTLALLQSDLHLTPEEWQVLQYSADILEIVDDITNEISAEKNVSISKIFFFVSAMEKHCLKFEGQPLNQKAHAMIKTFLNQIRERFKDIERNELLSQATLLDPRFKKYGFSNQKIASLALEDMKKKVSAIPNQENSINQCDRPEISHPTSEETINKKISLWNDFDEVVLKTKALTNPRVAGIIEVDKYINEPLISRHENPLLWWEQRKEIYPRLYELAKRRLCVPATSVPCERIFSKAGQIASEKRSRLKSTKISQILFLNGNL